MSLHALCVTFSFSVITFLKEPNETGGISFYNAEYLINQKQDSNLLTSYNILIYFISQPCSSENIAWILHFQCDCQQRELHFKYSKPKDAHSCCTVQVLKRHVCLQSHFICVLTVYLYYGLLPTITYNYQSMTEKHLFIAISTRGILYPYKCCMDILYPFRTPKTVHMGLFQG